MVYRVFGWGQPKIMVPTKELFRYLDYYDQVKDKSTYYPIRLENRVKTQLIGDCFTWKKDKRGEVKSQIDLFKHLHADECNQSDYIKPSKRWNKEYQYNHILRDHIVSAIKEVNGDKNDLLP